MNKKEKRELEKSFDNLSKLHDEQKASGLSMLDFMKRHLFEEYGKTGDKRLEQMAKDYYLENFDK